MKIRKILAAVAAAAMAASVMAFPVSADNVNVFVGFAADGWAFNSFDGVSGEGWTRTDATVTGDGTYTARVDFDAPVSGAEFSALITGFKADGSDRDSFFVDYPNMTITIDSITTSARTLRRDGDPFWKQEDGVMRMMIWNPWNGGGDADTYVKGGDNFEDAEWVEITFTVSGMGGGAAAPAETDTPAAPPAVSPPTGNTAVVAIVSVMAIAGVAAIVSRKRKE